MTRKVTAQPTCFYLFVLCLLDYCNSLLIDINCDQLYRLQNVQNHAAKLVFRKSRHEQARPVIKALHWLPVKEKIIFVFSVSWMVRCHHTMSSCLSLYTLYRTLRSSSDEKRKKKKEEASSYCAR